jgi:hypothetical protein
VYVRRFPAAESGGEWKVSAGGGQRARWSGDRRTIYYHAIDGKTIRPVPVIPGANVTVGSTETVMTVPALGFAWDVDRLSGRIVVTQPITSASAQIIVMQHWLDQFRRVAAEKP